ncbi:CST complex subunit Ten1 [Chaetomium fimeti]|uniref:CST complex subunit Ten1 n=1 Tax=Chaetomium fimeti TaxID=1854472 RepID=A0AAE0HM89_9PEZI|nr:CST complex subunit Ten1 [Chaetomium fimeti]
MSSYGPRPSQLCLLSSLPRKETGDKVRFLGCVTSYSPESGLLALEHRLPEDTHSVLTFVDVKLVLESLGSEQTRVGEWVNVIGYITDTAPITSSGELSRGSLAVHTQAVLLWSAGPFDIRRYETSVKVIEQATRATGRVTS